MQKIPQNFQVNMESMMAALREQRNEAIEKVAQYQALVLDQIEEIGNLREEVERLSRLNSERSNGSDE